MQNSADAEPAGKRDRGRSGEQFVNKYEKRNSSLFSYIHTRESKFRYIFKINKRTMMIKKIGVYANGIKERSSFFIL